MWLGLSVGGRWRVHAADARSWKQVALIAANQVHPPAKRPAPRKQAAPTCIGGTSVAQPTGTCWHAHNFTFLIACLEAAGTWGLTFSVVPFATWSALSECRVARWCCAFSHSCALTRLSSIRTGLNSIGSSRTSSPNESQSLKV